MRTSNIQRPTSNEQTGRSLDVRCWMLDVPLTMFAKSIRWRFVLWLAFLLTFILTGFGITAYQLQRMNRFGQLDEELKRRVAALSTTVRAPQPPGERGRNPGPPPEESFDGS